MSQRNKNRQLKKTLQREQVVTYEIRVLGDRFIRRDPSVMDDIDIAKVSVNVGVYIKHELKNDSEFDRYAEALYKFNNLHILEALQPKKLIV